MRAEYDALPGANGSARIALEDGTEALVGVKAEVEKSQSWPAAGDQGSLLTVAAGDRMMLDGEEENEATGKGQNAWVEMSVEIPGFREDDPLPVFLASMLTESLLASGELKDRLYINRRYHWKLYVDVGSCKSFDLRRANCTKDTSTISTALVSPRPFVYDHTSRAPHLSRPRLKV